MNNALHTVREVRETMDNDKQIVTPVWTPKRSELSLSHQPKLIESGQQSLKTSIKSTPKYLSPKQSETVPKKVIELKNL